MFFLKCSFFEKRTFQEKPVYSCGCIFGLITILEISLASCCVLSMVQAFVMLLFFVWVFLLCCTMDVASLFALLPPSDAPRPLARGRKRPLARASGSASGSGSAGAGERRQARSSGSAESGLRPEGSIMDVQALLDLLPDAGNCSKTKRKIAASTKLHKIQFRKSVTRHRERTKTRTAAKQQRSKIHKFNCSGKAVTHDDMMYPDGLRPGKIRGKGAWKEWIPEAIQKAAFSKTALKATAVDMADGTGLSATGKRSPQHVACCKKFMAKTITSGQRGGCQRLRRQSVHKRFKFFITNTVFDETKLKYTIRGMGFRSFSTLAHHTQITWKDDRGIHDEDIIHTPKAMLKYNAAVQWKILDEDGFAGLVGRDEERPQARFYATLTICDSHKVNHLTLKHARIALPPEHVLLPTFCIQHFTGNTASEVSDRFDIFTKVWCLSKTFGEGDFHQNLVKKIREVLEDEVLGLEVVDEIDFQLGPHDLGPEFTKAVMERCYTSGLGPGEDTVQAEVQLREKVKADFCKFFPCGWNRGPELNPNIDTHTPPQIPAPIFI